jgi:hypothetical protein
MLAQGATVTLSIPCTTKRVLPTNCKRGAITTFSRRSRRRLAVKLHQIKWPRAGCVFVTLTFAEEIPCTQAKAALHAFLTSLRYYLSGWGCVWKLEFGKQTGRLHFHLLLLPPQDASIAYVPKALIDRLWKYGFTWLEWADQHRIRGYLIKYSLKGWGPGDGEETEGGCFSLDQRVITEENACAPEWVGRFWGIRWDVVWADERLMTINELQAKGVWEDVERYLRHLFQACKEAGFVPRGRIVILLKTQVT